MVYGAHEEIIPPDVAMQMIRRLPTHFVAADGTGADRVATRRAITCCCATCTA